MPSFRYRVFQGGGSGSRGGLGFVREIAVCGQLAEIVHIHAVAQIPGRVHHAAADDAVQNGAALVGGEEGPCLYAGGGFRRGGDKGKIRRSVVAVEGYAPGHEADTGAFVFVLLDGAEAVIFHAVVLHFGFGSLLYP